MKADINFPNIEAAKKFASSWTRYTQTGCDMSAMKDDGSVIVKVYEIDDKKKDFIDAYIADYIASGK